MSTTVPNIDHSEWGDGADRVELFTVTRNGEPTTYSMPNEPFPGLALQYLKRARREGEALAGSWLLEQVLGEDGYDALAGEPDVTLEQVNGITARALQVVTGRVEPAAAAPFPKAP